LVSRTRVTRYVPTDRCRLFELEKHYFDAIDADGVLTIVYDCILRVFYGVLRWSYSSRQEAGGGQSVCREFHTRAATNLRLGTIWPPGVEISVSLGGGIRSSWKIRQPGPAPVTLLRRGGALGREILWQCHAPICDVVLGPEQRQATGYMETVRLRLLWPRLPIDRLHWGRFIGGDQSLIWIIWEGPIPRQLAWLNGRPAELAVFRPAIGPSNTGQLVVVAGGARLDVATSHAIVGMPLDDRLHASLGPARRLLPRQLRVIEDRKSLGTGALVLGDGQVVMGTAVFETIDLAV
jgi:hypothetical protein